MGDEKKKTRKRRRADDGHRPPPKAKRSKEKPTGASGGPNQLEPSLRGGVGSDAGSGEAQGSHGDGSASNKDVYYLFASDTIVCGIAEGLRLQENVLQNFPAATPSDKRYGNHAKTTLEDLEMRVEPPEPLEQIVRSIIQHPTDEDANASFATAWDILQAQREHYATQFSDVSSGEQLDEESARALNTALANLQAMEVFGYLRCWEGFSSDLATRLDGDRQLRGVLIEWNRMQLLMDGYVLVHGSRPQSERDAKHGKAAQRARRAWIREDSRWSFSDPPGSVHLVVGNEHRPPANVLFQQPPNGPHTTLDDPRTMSPLHVRRTTTTSSSTGPQPPPTRRPLGTTGSQQLSSASTARLEKLLVDLVRKVDYLEYQARNEFASLDREIRSARRITKEGIRKGQRDSSPLPPLRRLSLGQLDEYGPSIPGQRPVPGPVRIIRAAGLDYSPEMSPIDRSAPMSLSPGINPQGASTPQQSPDYGPPSSLSLSSELKPQGASTPKQFHRGRNEDDSTHEAGFEGETPVAGPSGTQ